MHPVAMVDRDATMPIILEESQTDIDTTLDGNESMIKDNLDRSANKSKLDRT